MQSDSVARGSTKVEGSPKELLLEAITAPIKYV